RPPAIRLAAPRPGRRPSGGRRRRAGRRTAPARGADPGPEQRAGPGRPRLPPAGGGPRLSPAPPGGAWPATRDLNPEAEKMGAKLTILFQHHKTDDVTRRRLETLARLNPGVSIVPLTHASDDVFPGTFNSARVPEFANENGWSGADVSMYAWFRHGRSA